MRNRVRSANSLRTFDFRRDNEIHFTGETTLDNGLTVGSHTEMKIAGSPSVGGPGGSGLIDESYAYFSGGWGRFNFGQEDGSAYLLQVSAPSADSNVDGMRVYIQALTPRESQGVGFPGSIANPDAAFAQNNGDWRRARRANSSHSCRGSHNDPSTD